MEKKIYVKFNLYLEDTGAVRRSIDFGFIFRQSFWKGFSDLTESDKFDWFNNRYIFNKNLSLKDSLFLYEKDENLKRYHSIYAPTEKKDIEDILEYFDKPEKNFLTVRTIFYFKGNIPKSMNFLICPHEGSLLENQMNARIENFDSFLLSLSKKEKMGQIIWSKEDREGLHVKGNSALDYVFNLKDPIQMKNLFDLDFWLKHCRKSLNSWRKKL